MKQFATFKDVPEKKLTVGGGPLCGGCPASLGLKFALMALGEDTIVINSSGCMTLYVTYPHMPTMTPWIHNAIENAGASASGIYAALKQLKKDNRVTILVYAGDGATYDIGFQSLSGSVSRGDKFIYVCYNNQCFGNTGVQKSSATPFGAYTTTTPIGRDNQEGNLFHSKPMVKIMADHGIPYAATASVGFPLDFMNKLMKAKDNQPAFIDLLSPCPTGWGFDPAKTVEMGKLAVQTGAWPLYEIKNGKFSLSYKPAALKQIEEYFKPQSRFSHLKPGQIKEIQKWIGDQWALLVNGKYWEASE
jgi:pyruvate ferredoxin oxidoreductase beta subunit